ncbi:iron ABC transporter, ATP-binding protein [Hyphomonas neptunium ATCC 15444]|uniref:Iron ABC transporter, ATP-binding protein n=2 Tax=Hyphomonas TaxID=85 RepID=Q0BYR8_HYPNA|nr:MULTISPECIES: ABC transporter ATP-binding protein [Hyphomonas]ABI75865.1 iron ABC transporter, ATP-binding protein [Hyphomonas neptunium ATCC 15444]KCZ91502.1 iron ABC transporter ATP-binding protein [Hyphomonas hirschiana VP5]
MSAALSAHQVTRRYGDRAVVDGVSLTLPPGQITALLGGSGAGKSTLLRLFAGLEGVDEGEIRIGEEVLSAPGRTVPAEKRRIGLIFQDFALFPHLTAARNVAFGLKHLPKTEAADRAQAWLARLGLEPRAGAYPHELSGGEQQRVAIARALAPEPSAILMDEPFSGLDPSLRDSVRDAALDAIRAAGIPALLVTHDPAEALEHADRIAILSQGKLLQEGPAHEIYTRPASAAVAGALGPVNRFRASAVPPGLLHGQAPEALILVRPEGVLIDTASPVRATLLSARMTGPLIRLKLDLNGLRLTALVPPVTGIVPGMETGVRLDPALTFTFASGEL